MVRDEMELSRNRAEKEVRKEIREEQTWKRKKRAGIIIQKGILEWI